MADKYDKSEQRPHVTADGQFKSDKYDWCPPGFLPLKLSDRSAHQSIALYAMRRRKVDPDFSEDLLTCLTLAAGWSVSEEWSRYQDGLVTIMRQAATAQRTLAVDAEEEETSGTHRWVSREFVGLVEFVLDGLSYYDCSMSVRSLSAVADERIRQIEKEGYTPEADDRRYGGDFEAHLPRAAAAYALINDDPTLSLEIYPWSNTEALTRSDYGGYVLRRRNLVRAAALLLAEIDRIDRLRDKLDRAHERLASETGSRREE